MPHVFESLQCDSDNHCSCCSCDHLNDWMPPIGAHCIDCDSHHV